MSLEARDRWMDVQKLPQQVGATASTICASYLAFEDSFVPHLYHLSLLPIPHSCAPVFSFGPSLFPSVKKEQPPSLPFPSSSQGNDKIVWSSN